MRAGGSPEGQGAGLAGFRALYDGWMALLADAQSRARGRSPPRGRTCGGRWQGLGQQKGKIDRKSELTARRKAGMALRLNGLGQQPDRGCLAARVPAAGATPPDARLLDAVLLRARGSSRRRRPARSEATASACCSGRRRPGRPSRARPRQVSRLEPSRSGGSPAVEAAARHWGCSARYLSASARLQVMVRAKTLSM